MSINRVYIVLYVVFGSSAWVRSVADRLAAQVHPPPFFFWAVLFFGRIAPDLELHHEPFDSAHGRRHKQCIIADQILGDALRPLTVCGPNTRMLPPVLCASVSVHMPRFWWALSLSGGCL